jgi:integrase
MVRQVTEGEAQSARAGAKLCRGCLVHLRATTAEYERRIRLLDATISDQAKALAAVTDELPPFAPSLAILYWIYGPTRWGEKNWDVVWNRLVPLIDELGDLPAMKLSPVVWATHRAKRKLTLTRTGEPIKDSTLNLELGRAKELLNWAVANGYIKFNPLSGAKAVKTKTSRETWLPLPDVERLLVAADDVVDRRLPEGDDDGFRAKVLRAFILCWHDSMNRFMEPFGFRRDKIGEDGRVELASLETKGGKRRVVFLTPRTLDAIADVPVDPDSPYVFSQYGQRLHPRRMHYWFRRCCELAGVDSLAAPGEHRITPHMLRASGASTADENGARATAIRDALGHSLLATTEIYLRSGQAENARSVAVVMTDATTSNRRGPKRRPKTRRGPKKSTGNNSFAVKSRS